MNRRPAKPHDNRVFGEGSGEGVFAKTSSPAGHLLASYLAAAPKGRAAELAREAGISAGTLSKIRRGSYGGNGEKIVEKLAAIIRDREAAEALASGKGRLSWLISVAPASRRSPGLRLVKRSETVDAIRERYPDSRIFQLWHGPEGDVKVWEVQMSATSVTELRRQRIEDALLGMLKDGSQHTQRELQEVLSKTPGIGTNYSPDAIYVTIGYVVRTFRRDFYRDPGTGKIGLSVGMLARIREEQAAAARARRMMGTTACGVTGEIMQVAEAE